MKKIKENNNRLIKTKNLKGILKRNGLRSKAEALGEIESAVKNYVEVLLISAKENMKINGRKNLAKEDVLVSIQNSNKKNEKDI